MNKLAKLCKDHGIKADFIELPEAPRSGKWVAGSRHYIAVLRRNNKTVQTDYSCGPGVKLSIANRPHAHDVLACLLSDASCGRESFEDFCSNFGSDPDSRSAYTTWQTCQRINQELEAMLGELRTKFEEAAADL